MQTTYIAIRRKPRFSQGHAQALSYEDKRERIRGELETTTVGASLATDLEGLGLRRGDSADLVSVATSLHGPTYARLEFLDGFILRLSTARQVDVTTEALAEAYDVLPDVALSLPRTQGSQLLGRKRWSKSNWPEVSGIQLAHAGGITGRGITIGVLDTGCDADHSQLRHTEIDFRYVVPLEPLQLRDVRGFDTDGHGTHVSGILVGAQVGIAPEATLGVAAVIESETTITSLSRLVTGLDWMLRTSVLGDGAGATVINMSLGFREETLARTKDAQKLVSAIRSVLRQLLNDFEILPIAAVGNDGPGQVLIPASFPEVLSVGAVDWDLNPACFSGGGKVDGRIAPDVVGFGCEVYSSVGRDKMNRSFYGVKSGTSVATPYVAGIAALVAQKTGKRGLALREHLIEHALPLKHPRERVGAGLARFVKQ